MSDPSQPDRRHTARLPPSRTPGRIALYPERDGSRTLRGYLLLSGQRVEVIGAYRPGAGVPLSETVLMLLPMPVAMGQRLDALKQVREMCEGQALAARMAREGVWAGEWEEAALRVRYAAGQWRAEMKRAG